MEEPVDHNCEKMEEPVETDLKYDKMRGSVNKKMKIFHLPNSSTKNIEVKHSIDSNSVKNAPTEEIEELKILETVKSNLVFPEDSDASDMLQGIDLINPWLNVTDRYFTSFYKIDVQVPGNDICILLHSNRICMITLAPSHTILQRGKEISDVNFRVSEKLDRAKNKVSGKGKHGAQPLQETSNICSITCSGEIFMIKCCIIGKLVEVNEALITNPSLLKNPPHKGGYIAIVLPNIKYIEEMKEKLLTDKQYSTILTDR